MKIIALLIIGILITGSAIAADSDESLFEKHLEEANKWIKARNVRITRSHYGPGYHKNLSVVHDVVGHTYIDYYWTMGPHPWAPSNQYPFRMSDILLRYDVSKSEFRLISFQSNSTGKQESEVGADQPATAPQLKSEGKDKPQPESKVRPR
jgi:hypothetical protein